jgi:hypothetical protein
VTTVAGVGEDTLDLDANGVSIAGMIVSSVCPS